MVQSSSGHKLSDGEPETEKGRSMIKQTWQYLNAKYGWNEEGATAVEYGIMVALIALVIIIAVTALGVNLAETFQNVADEVPGGEG
jgi:pilus assembly protein Flp/PilA